MKRPGTKLCSWQIRESLIKSNMCKKNLNRSSQASRVNVVRRKCLLPISLFTYAPTPSLLKFHLSTRGKKKKVMFGRLPQRKMRGAISYLSVLPPSQCLLKDMYAAAKIKKERKCVRKISFSP